MWFIGHSPERFGNRGFSSQKMKDTDNTIFQGSKDPWCMGGADGGMVFTKSDVTDRVEAVFNAPMTTIQVKNPGGVSLVGR